MTSGYDPTLGTDLTLPGDETGPRPAEPDRFVAGEKLGRYVVLEAVGTGGMGAVYAAWDPDLDRRVAIKLLHPQPGGSVSSRSGAERFVREAQAMARLVHPNVVTVHDVGTVGDRVFIAMEFVPGLTLGGWLAQSSRDAAEVLHVFVLAGRGLVAAHEAEIVHRDFKPENVLVGDDGRVLVGDFGLARTSAVTDPPEPAEGAASIGSSSRGSSERLTMTGAVMGTPAYMAPEQFAGRPVETAADQFAFCVALYEALYGGRPFEGDTLAALRYEIMCGNVRPPPRVSGVSARVERAVLRGLSKTPDERHPSMEALLEELTYRPGRSRRLWIAAVAATGAAIGGVAWAVSSRPSVCVGSDEALASTWNPTRRDALESVFRATNKNWVAHTWEPVSAELDAYSEQWIRTHTEACRDTRVRQTASEQMLDRRMVCLSQRKYALEAGLELLETADPAVLERAIEIAEGLPAIDRCNDLEALSRAVPPPGDSAKAEAFSDFRSDLSKARALVRGNQLERALPLAQDLVARAAELDYRLAEADALIFRGLLYAAVDRKEDAERDLIRAVSASIAIGATDRLTHAAIGLITTLSRHQERFRESTHWYEVAKAGLEQHPEPELRIDMLAARAEALRAENRLPESTAMFVEALELSKETFGEDDITTAAAYSNVGVTRYQLGDADGFAVATKRAIDIFERRYGADHPKLTGSYNNLGVYYLGVGDNDEAAKLFDRVLALKLGNVDSDSMSVASTRTNLGLAFLATKQTAKAREQLEAALEIYEDRIGANSTEVAEGLTNLASVLMTDGHFEEARTKLERAAEIFAAHPAKAPELALVQNSLGELFVAMKKIPEATDAFRRGYETSRSALSGDHPQTRRLLIEWLEAEVVGGDPTVAARQVQPLLEPLEHDDADWEGRAWFVLAQATTDPEEALAHARKAQNILEALPEEDHLEIVQTWISEHD